MNRTSGKNFVRALALAGIASLTFGCVGQPTEEGGSSNGSASPGGNGNGNGTSGPGSGMSGGTSPGSGNGSSGSGSNGSGSGQGNAGSGSSGSGSGNPGNGNGGTVMIPNAPSAQMACPKDGTDTIGRRSLRRLTASELEATVRNAFGLDKTQWPGPVLPSDRSSADGFTNNVDLLTVGPDYARGILDSGRAVARLVASPAILGKILPCGLGTGDGTTMVPCAQQFVATFGPKLYRRPLTPAETARYADLMLKTGRADFKNFAYWATLTMLQSPRVLYRSELGVADGTSGKFKLTSYEIASALAYTFTGGPPTADLMMLASGDKLQTADQIEAAARTLAYDPTGKVKPAFAAIMQNFVSDWVGLSSLSNLEKSATEFPGFKGVQDAIAEESRRFFSAVLFDDKGTPASLLTAPYTVVNGALAQYYGLPAGGADYAKVTRPEGWGLGLLAQGSFLAVEAHSLKTSPTKRGYFVRTKLMCQAVPPPPPVVGELPAPTEGETTRQRYEMLHAANPSCKGCHTLLDQVGFGLEHLDAGGRYREKEGRFDIDDSGLLAGTSTGDVTFKGAAELANAVAKLPEVAGCVASYAAAYAFGVSQSNASCLVRSATEKLRTGQSLVDFYISMARSDHFRLRSQ
jgi:hypothetical protein